ncbi:probable FAD-binding protein DIMINUTO [Cephalotrichum gorgonifer]|uniref:Delta(24)-sterol reductase n=1 Tax=Cephalotrichum gorgonifer TaxID=2041049 RepID=A0AAE8N0I7_9PEZI|nr:probable FAD-binding protein DIMINUTO [Cephalotrichum gorgonifer]
MERHAKAVAKISGVVKQFFDKKVPYRINHGSTNSTRPLRRDQVATVDIGSLRNVLEVNRARRTALVEPNVPMDRLVEATLAEGLVPPIVMEFPGITAGGGFAGTAGESSSFKHGFFDDTVNEVEMVLADGEVVRANREGERADLFRGAAGSVGTLGITTLLELRLKEAKPFVKTTYHRTNNVQEAVDLVREQTRNPENDYVDGILFSKDHGVVVTGVLADEKPASRPAQTFSGAWDPWYYLHVAEKTRSAAEPVVDYIPLAEYLFRYDRGGFWVGAGAFDYFKLVPFNRLTRWFLDDFLHTRMLYRALHGSGESERYFVQDLALPYSTAAEFVDYTSESLGIWPLWLAKNRELEGRLRELGGMKWLYAHAYYSEADFWQIYGRDWYDALRRKYQATALPTVYDKVNVAAKTKKSSDEKGGWKQRAKAMWPIGGLWGIRQSIKSRDYNLHRHAKWKHPGSDS